MSPAGPHHLEELDEAGGVYGIMKELTKKDLIDKTCLTVTGKKIGDILKNAAVTNSEVIHPISKPYHKKGWIGRPFRNPCASGFCRKAYRCAREQLAL